MKVRNALFLLISMAMAISVYGQDATNFTQFYINPYTINPSFAGIDGKSALFLAYRKQWTGIDGGPTITNFSFHAPLSKGMNAGIGVTNDSRGIIKQTSMLASFSYQLLLDRHKFVRFGASVGGAWNTIDLAQIGNTNDPLLASALSSNASLQGNMGISLHLNTFHIGASMPGIFSPSLVSNNAFTVTEVKPFQSIIAHASNRFYLANDRHIFEPYLVYRLNAGLPSQFEAAGIIHLNHVLWVGGTYKQDFGISAVGGIKLNNILAVGGSYTIKNTGINELNSPTFEIQLSYLAGKKKKDAEMYSFVSTVKEKERKTKSRSQLLAEKKAKEALEQKKKQELAKKEAEEKKKQEELAKAAVVVVPVVPPTVEPEDTAPKHDAGARFRSQQLMKIAIPFDTTNAQEQAKIAGLKSFQTNPNEATTEDDHSLKSDRHEFGKKGDHLKELPVGNYIVSAVFKTEASATTYHDGLNKMGFKSKSGYSSEKELWFVYITTAEDINEAEKERENHRKTKLFHDVWILTVYQ